MKRTLLIFCLLLSVLLVCQAEQATDSALPTFAWERNATEHWHVLPDGKVTDRGAHALNDAHCTICGSEVWAFDSGAADVSDYNDHGDLVRYTLFDEDGEISFELCYAYEYDAQGYMLVSREYVGGVLTGEITYDTAADGRQIPVGQVVYYEDDTWSVSEYDEHGNLLSCITYAADGTLLLEEQGEFCQDASGSYYEFRHTSRYADGAVSYTEFNQYGDPVLRYNLYADGTVWEDTTCEYEYQNGMLLWKKQYESGVMTLEVRYHADGYIEQETEFYEGGAKMVTDFNDHADPVTVTSYHADGSIESVHTYVYEYNEDMSWRTIRTYADGDLVILTEYADEDGWHYVCRETIYDEDGSYTVFVFNSADELVSETSYAANGQAQ